MLSVEPFDIFIAITYFGGKYLAPLLRNWKFTTDYQQNTENNEGQQLWPKPPDQKWPSEKTSPLETCALFSSLLLVYLPSLPFTMF